MGGYPLMVMMPPTRVVAAVPTFAHVPAADGDAVMEATAALADLFFAGRVTYVSFAVIAFFALSMMLQRAHRQAIDETGAQSSQRNKRS